MDSCMGTIDFLKMDTVLTSSIDDNICDWYPEFYSIFARDDRRALVFLVVAVLKELHRLKLTPTEMNLKVFGLRPHQLLYLACVYRACNCAAALLEGETGLTVDVVSDLDEDEKEYFPLHTAASLLEPDLVDLLLCHGARTNIRGCGSNWENNFLPLEVALEALPFQTFVADWTSKESLYKLITVLCLPKLRKSLETIRLLASRTEEVNEVFDYYAREGNFIQMAALMMVSRKRLMALNTLKCQGDESLPIFQSMKEEMWTLTLEETKSLLSKGKMSKSVQMCKSKRAVLMSKLFLVQLFDKAGVAIESYLQLQPRNVPKKRVIGDVATILRNAGMPVEVKDIDLSDLDRSFDVVDVEEVPANESYLHHGHSFEDVKHIPRSGLRGMYKKVDSMVKSNHLSPSYSGKDSLRQCNYVPGDIGNARFREKALGALQSRSNTLVRRFANLLKWGML